MNEKNQIKFIKAAEILRWTGVTLGIFLAFLLGTTPIEQFSIVTIWVLVSLHGLTALESLLFGKVASKISGYKYSRSQKQSAINNLAVAVAIIAVYLLGWGLYAKASLVFVMILFFTFSGVNHALSAIVDKNRHLINILRPFMSFLIVGFMLFFLLSALAV